METKTYVWLGLAVGSTVGGLLGMWLDHGNSVGLWTILLSTAGGLGGIWAGYQLSRQ